MTDQLKSWTAVLCLVVDISPLTTTRALVGPQPDAPRAAEAQETAPQMLENVYADTVVHEDLLPAGFATNRGIHA